MAAEIFRFVTIRPPQHVDRSQQPPTIDLTVPKSGLADELRAARASGARGNMVAVASKFTGSADFLASPEKLDPKLGAFTDAVQGVPDAGFRAAAGEAFSHTIGGTPAAYIKTAAFTGAYSRVSDSILAAAIDSAVAPKVRGLLVRVARALWLIRQMANGTPVTRADFATAALSMPPGIFPLPVADPSLQAQRQAQAQAYQAALAARQKRLAQLASDLAAQRAAVDELLNTFELTGAQPASNPSTRRVSAGAAPPGISGFVLPDAAANALSDATKGALRKIGLPTTSIDVGKTATVLERRSAMIATQLYTGPGSRDVMVRVGQNLVPRNALLGGFIPVVNPGPNDVPTPGPCPPAAATTISDGGPSVPTGHGDARVLGIADLLVVEQALARYRLGEISHIENVLRSEVRSRRFRTTDTTQVTQTTETETTETKERDLSTDQRFQLQTESQTVINENASKDAGLTIHASYGPSVDATANYNTSSSTSKQQSNQAAATYSQEITNKAVDRIQTKTLTSRTVTTTHVTDEIDRHAFDNKAGASDIVGVYRFVDKIYSAQIVNYGKRLLLEFIVPEPAAFLRYAMSNQPVDRVTLTKPDPPGYCLANGTTFQPLQATDITRDNYLYWASLYGATDVTPPPPSAIVASGVKKAPDSMPKSASGHFLGSDTLDVAIADGYLTQSAFVNIYGETEQAPKVQIVFQLQEQQGVYSQPGDDNHLFYLHLLPTPTLTVTINSNAFYNYEVLVTIFCTLSIEKFQEWQLKTFNSIMSAYNDLKSAYDQAVQQAKLQAAAVTTGGINPEYNRITEQAELKKGCISLLTAQRFDLFDAVNRNVAPYGYPEIDFVEAKAEGAYITAFEQSFEWNNMVYLFYPYFWGKKDVWPAIVQLSDPDPLFQQFLQAGAARVQVPVRPGFEAGVLSYLSTGELWGADGTLLNSDSDGVDPQYLSIVDELKSQTGNNNIDGVGRISVTQNSPKVTGNGTEFTSDDENRRIIIAGVTYVIKSVGGPDAATLTTPYAGNTEQDIGYALGGQLVGQPWEVTVPTDFVKLDESIVFS